MSNEFGKAVSAGIIVAGTASGLLGRAAGESSLTDQLSDSYTTSQESQREQSERDMESSADAQNQSTTSGSN